MVGVDVGATFTDLFLLDAEAGAFRDCEGAVASRRRGAGLSKRVEGAAVLRRFDRMFMAPQLQPTPYSSAAAELVPRLLLAG
jgi:hypothetical protein